MTVTQRTSGQGPIVRMYEYEEESVVVADLASLSGAHSVDVVDGTAIVVSDDGQFEIELPDETNDPHTFMKNGVLSIEVEGNR